MKNPTTKEDLTAEIKSLRVPIPEVKWNNLASILDHSFKGGSKAFLITYILRASIPFFIKIVQLLKSKKNFLQSLIVSMQPFYRKETFRFASMFASFTFLWKFLNNSLLFYRKKQDKLNGFIAGSVASTLSILIETKETRRIFSQQLFIRAMQSYYNHLKKKGIINFPRGDAFLFIFSTASIIYAYFMQPDTIPKEYYSWIVKMGKYPKEVMKLNRENVRNIESGNLDKTSLDSAVNLIKKFTKNKHLEDMAVKKTESYFKVKEFFPTLPCSVTHPNQESCLVQNMDLFTTMFQNMLPIYLSLNVIPMIVFRGKSFVKTPLSSLCKSILASLRSSLFLSSFVIVNGLAKCTQRNLIKFNLKRNFPFLPSVDSKKYYYLFGVLCSSTIFIENKSRRSELAMYVLPKGLNSIYQVLLNRGFNIYVKNFDIYLVGVGMGFLMSFYQTEPDVINSLLFKVMNKVIGRY